MSDELNERTKRAKKSERNKGTRLSLGRQAKGIEHLLQTLQDVEIGAGLRRLGGCIMWGMVAATDRVRHALHTAVEGGSLE
jgi:hypothetical protein